MLLRLWLWHRPATAAPFGPLVQEFPFATGAAGKRKQNKLGSSLFKEEEHYNTSIESALMDVSATSGVKTVKKGGDTWVFWFFEAP